MNKIIYLLFFPFHFTHAMECDNSAGILDEAFENALKQFQSSPYPPQIQQPYLPSRQTTTRSPSIMALIQNQTNQSQKQQPYPPSRQSTAWSPSIMALTQNQTNQSQIQQQYHPSGQSTAWSPSIMALTQNQINQSQELPQTQSYEQTITTDLSSLADILIPSEIRSPYPPQIQQPHVEIPPRTPPYIPHHKISDFEITDEIIAEIVRIQPECYEKANNFNTTEEIINEINNLICSHKKKWKNTPKNLINIKKFIMDYSHDTQKIVRLLIEKLPDNLLQINFKTLATNRFIKVSFLVLTSFGCEGESGALVGIAVIPYFNPNLK